MSDSMVTSELLARLQRHYIKPGDPMPGGMFLPEVALEGRRADALYVGFFRSRGKFLVGHELKVSRADWLHELDQPAKAEVWEPQCHAWYVVAPSIAIVHPTELPHGWGLMVPNPRTKTRMDVVVKATVHEDRSTTWEATHALVQKADSLRMSAIAEARTKIAEATHAEVQRMVDQRLALDSTSAKHLRQRAENAEALLSSVSAALGLRIVPSESNWVGQDAISVAELATGFGQYMSSVARQRMTLSSRERALAQIEQTARGLADDAAKVSREIRSQIAQLAEPEDEALLQIDEVAS